jgi:large subunit ribosomal protein L47
VPSNADDRLTEGPGNASLTQFLEAFVDPYEVDPKLPPPGRRWSAAEIRLKSDDDLQKLWVVLLRERNMLYSVKMLHERRKTSMPHRDRLQKTRKSMAMIKRVLGERDRAAAAAGKRGEFLNRKQRDAIARKSQEVEGGASRAAGGGADALDIFPLSEPRA